MVFDFSFNRMTMNTLYIGTNYRDLCFQGRKLLLNCLVLRQYVVLLLLYCIKLGGGATLYS